jgi:hypothetical protein
MDLRTAVRIYLDASGGHDQPLHLSRFGLSKEETERIFSAWDEDYQISRFMLLSRERDEALNEFLPEARVYLINGFEVSHVSFREGIQQLL